MAKQFIKFLFVFFLATNVLAGGDDRDNQLVESLDAVSNSACSDAEGAVPCADWVVSPEEEALQMALSVAEQVVLDEIAAFEAELATQQLADNLAAFQAKIAAERALAAENLAAFKARQAVEKEIADFEAALAAEQALELEIAEFEAELAAQQLADNLAAFQAKIDAERALAAKNLASFKAKQAAEKEIAEFEAALAAEQALAKELADFEAELIASLEADKKRAADKVVTDEIAAFEAALAAERALEQELADFEAELAAALELDKQQAAALAAKLAAELAAFEAYHSCKARLDLSDANIAKFKAGIATGNLYNIGPQVANGTNFSANRWGAFFSCQEPT